MGLPVPGDTKHDDSPIWLAFCRYYEKRREKKKAKKMKGKPEAELTPAELKLRAQESATQARFGEIADAPLKVGKEEGCAALLCPA